MPNRIRHLFALSDIFDRDSTPYGRMYGETLPAADSASLHDNRSLIGWGDSRLGKLAPPCCFSCRFAAKPAAADTCLMKTRAKR